MRCKVARWDYSVETSLINASYATLGPAPSVQKLGGSIEYPRRDALGLKKPKTRPFNKREGTKGKEVIQVSNLRSVKGTLIGGNAN